MIRIDGSAGEGGGQIFRTALGLSLVTGKPFQIVRIRAGRPKPGLLSQHLTALNAAREISQAAVTGDRIGSYEVSFTPAKVKPGNYQFNTGTAGSATLVFQTILPCLLLQDKISTLTIEGGTHNPGAPPFDFLKGVYLDMVNRMGVEVKVFLDRYGFYPAGGGKMRAEIRPAASLSPLSLMERGRLKGKKAEAVVAGLPVRIAQEEVEQALMRLKWAKEDGFAHEVRSSGPGNAFMLKLEYENMNEVITAFGQKGLPNSRVVSNALNQYKPFLKGAVAVGECLADQLLIPLALAGGGSFRTLQPSLHTRTNIEVIRKFLEVTIGIKEVKEGIFEIAVAKAG
jgi:RNA 3'-terminal phosphate cyclase (ATP)